MNNGIYNFINIIKNTIKSRIFIRHFILYLSIFILSFAISTIIGINNINISKTVIFYVINFTSLKFTNGDMLSIVINNFFISILLMYFFYLEGRFKKYFGIFYFLYNGFIAGLAVSIASLKYNIIIAESLILPHGIIEIPTIIIAVSSGLYLRELKNKNNKKYEKGEKGIFREFIFISFFLFSLLTVAGFVESHITPNIFNLLISYYRL